MRGGGWAGASSGGQQRLLRRRQQAALGWPPAAGLRNKQAAAGHRDAPNPQPLPPTSAPPQLLTVQLSTAAGQNLSNLDSLFVGKFLGHKSDIADGSLRAYEMRSLNNIVGDYYVAPRCVPRCRSLWGCVLVWVWMSVVSMLGHRLETETCE